MQVRVHTQLYRTLCEHGLFVPEWENQLDLCQLTVRSRLKNPARVGAMRQALLLACRSHSNPSCVDSESGPANNVSTPSEITRTFCWAYVCFATIILNGYMGAAKKQNTHGNEGIHVGTPWNSGKCILCVSATKQVLQHWSRIAVSVQHSDLDATKSPTEVRVLEPRLRSQTLKLSWRKWWGN